jgi:hypothetical protein
MVSLIKLIPSPTQKAACGRLLDRLVGGCCLGQYNEVVDFDFGDEAALAAEAVEAPDEFAFDGEVHAFGAEFFDNFGPAAPGAQEVPLAALAHDAVGVEELFFGGEREAHELLAVFELHLARLGGHVADKVDVVHVQIRAGRHAWLRLRFHWPAAHGSRFFWVGP